MRLIIQWDYGIYRACFDSDADAKPDSVQPKSCLALLGDSVQHFILKATIHITTSTNIGGHQLSG
jgi:hypothetical protein